MNFLVGIILLLANVGFASLWLSKIISNEADFFTVFLFMFSMIGTIFSFSILKDYF